MFEASKLMFIFVETPLHAGSGRGMGAVDNPIQRERATQYPMVQGSGIKGVLRAETEKKFSDDKTHQVIFGPDTKNAADHAGALSVGDARLLLFPVRSLAGVTAWATSRKALARFRRDIAMAGITVPSWTLPDGGDDDTALVSGNSLIAGQGDKARVVLEEFSFKPDLTDANKQVVQTIGHWLAKYALPTSPEYAYWKTELPKKLCILPESAFRDFVLYATEVQTHVKINPDKKTAEGQALWTTESLPSDSLLYAPLMTSKSRFSEVDKTAAELLQEFAAVELSRVQLGGDETTGQGMVALRMYGGGQ